MSAPRPADQHAERPLPLWLHVVYLGLLFIAFGAAGRVDMEEQERLSMEAYVNDHAIVTYSVADSYVTVTEPRE